MAAFASCRRSGWVRLLVVILCALFIFATIATPPAYAVGETAALFGAAAVLSAAVAALGFKLSNDSDGIATLNKMVSDFAKEAWALNVLVVGNRINGLIDGMNYIKMAVHNGKTYLDERVVAWCQQWLGANGVYDSGTASVDDYVVGQVVSSFSSSSETVRYLYNQFYPDIDSSVQSDYGLYFLASFEKAFSAARVLDPSITDDTYVYIFCQNGYYTSFSFYPGYSPDGVIYKSGSKLYQNFNASSQVYVVVDNDTVKKSQVNSFSSGRIEVNGGYSLSNYNRDVILWTALNLVISANDTGLSGTDTIGEDYKDKTLDQILDGLKDWAQDWYDAGADSATNTATGALDLPVTVGDQAATANPALNPDVVYNPPFSIPWPGVRSGETSSGAISDGKANADAAETATTDVAENQSVIDSLVNWALNYINPDTGLFSKFPLCVPYDAYLLVTSSLGVDAVGSDSIFGASPGDLNGVVSQDTETYSDFQPIINIKHDFELDGATYPLELTIDLTPWQPLVTFFREGMALLLVAELIGAEFKRIRGH